MNGGGGAELTRTKGLQAFTLAEALIALAIIGVVAAMTIPTLTASYRKKVLETRIKHFFSVMQQVVYSKNAQDGTMECDMLTQAFNPDQMQDFFDKNYKPYLKTTSVEKLTKGVAAALANGSGIFLLKDYNTAEGSCGYGYVIFCVDYLHCKKINDAITSANIGNSGNLTDGRNSFHFYLNDGEVPDYYKLKTIDRQTLLTRCAGAQRFWCSSLIKYDGWEIKDDYPHKL